MRLGYISWEILPDTLLDFMNLFMCLLFFIVLIKCISESIVSTFSRK